jgi:hypothetical protein
VIEKDRTLEEREGIWEAIEFHLKGHAMGSVAIPKPSTWGRAHLD